MIMNARNSNTRWGSPTPWLAAGAVVLVLVLAGPVGIARATDSFASDPIAEQAVVYPTPASKPGNGPVVAQPGNPCTGSVPMPGCNPRPVDPTATPTAKPKPPTDTPT